MPTLSHSILQPAMTINYNGEHPSFVMTPPKLVQPSTYREWLELFLIYASILIEARPQEAAGLFTYIARIGELEAADHPLVWFEYDIAFRRLKAMKQDLPWQRTVMEILWPIQKRRQMESHRSSSYSSQNTSQRSNQPFQRASGGSPPPETCHCYYYKGFCNKIATCPYNHICGHCQRAGHPLTKCHQAKGSNQNCHHNSKPNTSSRQGGNASKQT